MNKDRRDCLRPWTHIIGPAFIPCFAKSTTTSLTEGAMRAHPAGSIVKIENWTDYGQGGALLVSGVLSVAIAAKQRWSSPLRWRS